MSSKVTPWNISLTIANIKSRSLQIHAQNGPSINSIDSIDILQENNYERHVIMRHGHSTAYPNKAEIEKMGLKAHGRECET
jgi:hypothetical protein